MKRHRLTEAEERRLAEAIAAEARAMGLTKKGSAWNSENKPR